MDCRFQIRSSSLACSLMLWTSDFGESALNLSPWRFPNSMSNSTCSMRAASFGFVICGLMSDRGNGNLKVLFGLRISDISC